jgi:hypothetical protein
MRDSEQMERPFAEKLSPTERCRHTNVLFEELAVAGTQQLSRLVLRRSETFEINFDEPTSSVVHCARGACNVVTFAAPNVDLVEGETLRCRAETLYFQRTTDEVVLLILTQQP